jgi:hypothetical protein
MLAVKAYTVESRFPALSEAGEILAVYTLHCGLPNKEFTAYGLLAERTFTDFVGKLPEWL